MGGGRVNLCIKGIVSKETAASISAGRGGRGRVRWVLGEVKTQFPIESRKTDTKSFTDQSQHS